MNQPLPYSPPKAPLDAEPPVQPSRPLLLKVAVGVLAFEMVGGLLLTLFHVWYLKQANPSENYSPVLVGALGLPLVEGPLIWFVARGANWARYTLALLLAFGLCDYIINIGSSHISDALPFELARDWGSYGLMVLGITLAFTPKVSTWFRQVQALK
jgi:hypothetical protein